MRVNAIQTNKQINQNGEIKWNVCNEVIIYIEDILRVILVGTPYTVYIHFPSVHSEWMRQADTPTLNNRYAIKK